MNYVILGIIATIVIGVVVVTLQKSKTPENKGGDVEQGNGDLGGGLGKNK